MRELAERAWFLLSRGLARLLRAARYSGTRVGYRDGEMQVRKHRRFYAPLLIWIGNPLLRILDAGVRILPQREWEEREQLIYPRIHGTPVRIDAGGTLALPWLAGRTLALLLEDPELPETVRHRAMALAAVALAEFHRQGFTHGDAMAENVMIDVESDTARWFDFETVHEAERPLAWRRSDDLRALLVTCLVRTAPERRVETVRRILEAYGDDEVARLLTPSLTSVLRCSLPFHLGQAGLSYRTFREVGRLLSERPRNSRAAEESRYAC